MVLFKLISNSLRKASSYILVNSPRLCSIRHLNNLKAMTGKQIGTHSGVFHCDEVLACFLLQQLPEWNGSKIVRSRDPNVLDSCDIVVDVGGIYDPNENRFDHHQRGFEHTISTVRPDFPNKKIKLSSAGLIYAHFGEKVLRKLLPDLQVSENDWFLIYKRVYDTFVEEMDGIDNGIPMSDGKINYRVMTHLGSRVHNLNPAWNEDASDVNLDELFVKAMKLVGGEFVEHLDRVIKQWLPARQIVRECVEKRFDIHPSGALILMEKRCSWRDHIHSVEDELGLSGVLKFVIFGDTTGQWRVQAIPEEPDSFICRVFLNEKWRGVRDSELSEVSGIPGCVFCHSNGFIGGNATREGAIQMAVGSLPE